MPKLKWNSFPTKPPFANGDTGGFKCNKAKLIKTKENNNETKQ